MHDYRWKLLLTVPRCHRWFQGVRRDGSPGIAVCDQSGDLPHETDDGVIWLDLTAVHLREEGDRDCNPDSWNLPPSLSLCNAVLHGVRDDGSPVQIGGTNGMEAERLREAVPGFRLEVVPSL